MLETLHQELHSVPLFHDTGDEIHTCLDAGEDFWLEPGMLVAQEGSPADYFFVLLQGEVLITKKLGGQDFVLDTYKNGTFFGELPILIGTPYQATGRTLQRSHLFRLQRDNFLDLLTRCRRIAGNILQTMAWRIQNIQSFSQQHERMAGLGKLAAGLAHEMNNPAAAARRAAAQLRTTSRQVQTLAHAIQAHLSAAQWNALGEIQTQLHAQRGKTLLDPLTQSDREDELSTWLEDHNVARSWELAPTLIAASVDLACLETLAAHTDVAILPQVIAWLEASLTEQTLIDTIEHSTERISELVSAIKTYSYMDQAPVQEVDIHAGLESTLMIMAYKLKQGITLIRDYAPDLPAVCAYGSELNQVWTNLIDNAIDALDSQGEIRIRTTAEPEHVLVEVIDNGPGIPPDVQQHIFEPFFTTKPVGKGTGLGLDTSYRIIVQRHHGDLRVISQPGMTCFQVWLPSASKRTP